MKEENLMISINELMSVLRRSLTLIQPEMRKIGILNEKNKGYDSWDNISETLFKEVVSESINSSEHIDTSCIFELPKYGFRFKSYNEMNYIQVHRNVSPSHENLAFLEFIQDEENKLDRICVAVLSDEYSIIKEDYLHLNQITFSCSYWNNGSRMNLSELNIEL